MFTTEQARAALDATVYTTDGEKIGKVGQIYLDDETNEPEWVTVATGLFGVKENFVPLADARLEGDRVVVPYDKDKIKDAPQIDAGAGQISREEEGQLYRYYGKDYENDDGEGSADSGAPRTERAATGTDRDATSIDVDRDLAGTNADRDAASAGTERSGTTIGTDADLAPAETDRGRDADTTGDTANRPVGLEPAGSTTDDALRQAEEQLNAGRTSGGGRVRLRKYIVTEEQTITVPVLREEVRVERDTDTDTAPDTDTDTDTTDTNIDLRGERSTSPRTN